MARKKDVVKKIDQKTKNSGAPLPLLQEDQPTPPAFAFIPEPTDLVLVGQAIQRSTQAALVAVAISWQEAPNISPDYYNVDFSENADFTYSQRRRALTTSATIDGLKANGVTYYFKVQAVVSGIYSQFSNTLVVTTMNDDTPPPDVLTPAAAFQNSDLVVTYVVPNSEILKDVQIDIYNAARTIHFGTFYTRAERFVWTAEQNIFATGGIPLTSVSVDIHTRSWSNQPSIPGLTVTATAAVPATPTGYTSNWISDNGTASADFVTAWLSAANANDYQLTIDGKDYFTRDLKFVYSFEQNVADHKPTLPSGSASFIWLLKARDKLGQSSVPVNVTVTNAAPPSGVMSMSVNGGFATIGATVSLLGNTIVQDFDHYEWAISSGSTVVQTFNTPDPSVIFQLGVAGTYTPSVRMVDRFNQKSATLSGAPTLIDTLTIEQLRAETIYIDWLGTSAAVLQRLKDGVLYDGSGAYQFYAANAGWQWTEASRPLLDRYKTVTFSAFWGAGLSIYYEIDTPNGMVYYAGPVTVSANGDYVMTRYTSQATAITNAYAFVTAGNGTRRFDFTRLEESRRIRLYFKDTVSTMGLYEFYPRRLIQSDDIEAESIRSINIAAGGINADRIFAITLSALSAFIGQLNIDATGWLYQGTGTGTTPITGLKIFNSGGIGKLSTYNTGVEQITLDTDGKLKAGAGAVLLDASGITVNARFITPGYGAPTTTGIKWKFGALTVATIEGLVVDDTPDWYTMEFRNTYQANSQTNILASYNVTLGAGNAAIYLTHSGSGHGSLQIGATTDIVMTGGNLLVGYTGGGTLSVFGDATVTGNLAVGATLTPSRALTIFGDNEYISWNDASGVESWVAGYETVGADRWILYNPNAGYVINAAWNGIVTFASNTVHQGSVTSQGASGGQIHLNNTTSGGDHRNYIRFYEAGVHMWEWGTDYDATGGQSIYFYDVLSAAHRLVIGSLGGVQIGYRMIIGSIGGSPTHQITLTADSAGKPTTNTWSVISDERTKKNIKPFDHGLKDLRAFPMPVSFNYNGVNGTPDDGSQGIGYIAQAVQKVAPKMVGTDDNGFLHINTGAMQMMFHTSIIEVDDRVLALEKKIKELEAKLKG